MGYFANNCKYKNRKNSDNVDLKSNVLDLPLTSEEEDLLNIEIYQKGLIDYIKNADMPITLAIQGGWGSGKTSLMNVFYDNLCKYNNPLFYGIRVNTWHYSLLSTTQQAVVGILKSIIEQINSFQPDKELGNKALEVLMRALIVGAKFVYDVADQVYLDGTLKNSGWDSNTVQKEFSYIKNGNDTENSDNTDETSDSAIVEQLKKEIDRLVHHTLILNNECRYCHNGDCEYKTIANNFRYTGEKKGFIFFIDDLDRIDPSLAVEILEIIKNLFDLPYCIFVLAVDYSIIVKGLEPKLGELKPNNAHKFRRYFDKLVQLPITIPTELYHIQSLLGCGLSDVGFLNNDLLQDDAFILKLCEITEKSVGKNPRSVKRLINTISLIDKIILKSLETLKVILDIDEIKSNREYRTLVFILACIQIAYPFIYKVILKYPDVSGWNNDIAMRLEVPHIDHDLFSVFRRTENNDKYSYLKMPSCCQEWEEVLFGICGLESHLRENFFNILVILNEFNTISKQKMFSSDQKWDLVIPYMLYPMLITEINI